MAAEDRTGELMPPLSNPRHEKFAQILAKGGVSADEAYVKAGFKKNRHNASRLRTNETISARIAELAEKAAEKAVVDAAEVLRRLDNFSRGNLKRVANWRERISEYDEKIGKYKVSGGLELKDLGELSDEDAAIISEISETESGTFKIKLHDAKSATVDLARHFGLFNNDKSGGGDVHVHIDEKLKGVL